MRKTIAWALGLGVVCALGCESKAPEADVKEAPEATEPAAENPTAEAGKSARKPAAQAAEGKATVSKEGTEFDPPIAKSEVPDGAYYCDMGTVHYARMEEGDGKCPLCGMKLVTGGGSGASAEGHEGHAH